ncbi:MAG: glycoside hydrolase family 88 protein [Phaeodactylibacter sp.]|nr:glycoside hydrolase family 88 protein [Phaeodactylibacter sp.]MCB9274226.1 glycoside hydrolase family 88 protein [Lewinellaceae bacterium]
MKRIEKTSFRLFHFLPFLCLLLANPACKNSDQPTNNKAFAVPVNISTELPWSERMALSIIKRSPEAWMNDFSKEPSWNYTHGLIMLSILRTWDASKKALYFDYVKSYADTMIYPDGSIRDYQLTEFNIDHVNPGKFLFGLYEETGQENYKTAISTLKHQLDWQPRTKDGGFWHKLRYPWQMWLDGLYMGAPFYAEYAMRNNEPALFDDIALQFTLMEQHARDPKTGLLYHGWDQSRSQRWSDPQTGLSPNFWGRAIGWYSMALVDALDFFPEGHPKRDTLIAVLRRTMEAVEKVQDPGSGMWYQVLDQPGREGNYLESTASCMFTYAMAKGVNNGYLDKHYKEVAEKAFAGILENVIRVDGSGEVHLENCCAVAGLGGNPYRDGSYEYYVSEPIRDNDPKGIAPFILASLELEKAAKSGTY